LGASFTGPFSTGALVAAGPDGSDDSPPPPDNKSAIFLDPKVLAKSLGQKDSTLTPDTFNNLAILVASTSISLSCNKRAAYVQAKVDLSSALN